MPTVQLGTYRIKTATGPCRAALTLNRKGCYLYSGVDTASIYGNEDGVGQAVSSIVRRGVRTRKDIFVQTKLWRSQQGLQSNGRSKIPAALRASLRKLGLDYVDLWLLHWPGPGRHLSKPPVRKCTLKEGWSSKKREQIPGNDKIKVPKDWSPEMRLETWRQMSALSGKDKSVRAVGVCNFSARQLRKLIEFCEAEKIAKPAVVQNECHPFLPATEIRAVCAQHNIVFQAYASLGSGAQSLFEASPVQKAAKCHSKSPAQVLLRWAVQKGMAVVPKTTSVGRMEENANIFDFTLSSEEMEALDSLDRGENSQNTMFCWKREFDPDEY